MSRPFNTNTFIDRFRVRGMLRGMLVYSLILSMFMPSLDLLASTFYNPSLSGSKGGGEKEATIYFFNGKEWTTAPLAMEVNDNKPDSLANSALFYHNGIMWVKTDMYEEDVAGTSVMKVNLPLEELAGKPDVPADDLVSQLNEPVKIKSTETASDDVAPVLNQPTSKLEKNLNSGNGLKPNRTLPVLNDVDDAAPINKTIEPPIVNPTPTPAPKTITEPVKTPAPKVVEKPVIAPVVTKTPAPTPVPKTITEPVKTPAPKVVEKPVVAPVVTKTPAPTPVPKTVTEPVKAPAPKVVEKPVVAPVVAKTPAPTPAPKTITEPVKAPAPKVVEKPVVAPVVTKTPAPKPTTVIEAVPKTAPSTAPIPITSLPKPINWEEYDKQNNTAVPKYVMEPEPTKPVVAPMPITNSKPAPKLDAAPAKNIVADAKPIVVPVMPKVNNNEPIVVADKPGAVPFSKPVLAPVKESPVVADVKPVVVPILKDQTPTNEKPVFPPLINPLVKTENMPLVFRPEYLNAASKPVIAISPIPLVKKDASPVIMPLDYNLSTPIAYYETPSFAYRPERGPAPVLPANFVLALNNKQSNVQVPVDTPPKVSPLTNFIKSAEAPAQQPGDETITQEPKKEDEAKKEEDTKKNKKKDKDPEPVVVEQPLNMDTIKKLIHEEVTNAVGGKLPLSANTPEQDDTATVELPPAVTINDTIEELRKLNLQLQAELDEKLMLRDKLEGQVDEQRQIKKEARLEGDLGKKDTLKLSNESYVVREYKFALDNEIFGWHPYWMGDSYRSYDYSLLTTLAYFSYELDPRTGGYKTIHDWKNTEIIELAQEKGCKVVLTATCLNRDDLSLFLASNKAQDNFVKTIRDLIVDRNANGVNINFEKLNDRYRSEFVELIKKLNKSFKELNPDYQISITIPAIDYKGAYDVEALEPYVDLFIMMGYEYTGSYSVRTGPTAPLDGGASYAQYNLGSSIDAYLKNKVPANKLILAIPYYGVQWEVEGNEVPGRATKFIKSMSYAQIKAQYGDREPLFYEASLTPYYNTPITGRYNMFNQVWFDNARSLGMKFDMIMEKQLGGVGIWALGMDGGNKEFWNVLEDKFLKIVPVPMDTITIKKAETSGGIGKWLGSKFRRVLSILRRPSTYNPANSNIDRWLRMFMVLGGLTLILARVRFVVRRLQMGSRYKASKPYLYVMITAIAVLTVSLLMWARITRFFERIYQSSSFLFSVGLIIGIILAVIFILWILPKWLKNKELP